MAVHGPSPGVRAGHVAVSYHTKASQKVHKVVSRLEICIFLNKNKLCNDLQVYVIGGVGDKKYYNDVWLLDTSTCLWSRLEICGQKPQGRFSHTAVATDTDIAIYGG